MYSMHVCVVTLLQLTAAAVVTVADVLFLVLKCELLPRWRTAARPTLKLVTAAATEQLQ